MTTQKIAKTLYDLCSSRQFAQAQMNLYSDDSISVEPSKPKWGLKTVKGKKAVLQKGKAFMESVTEWNAVFISQPIIYGPFIFMEMQMDFTFTELGKISIREMGRFEVKDGQIISEEFYY